MSKKYHHNTEEVNESKHFFLIRTGNSSRSLETITSTLYYKRGETDANCHRGKRLQACLMGTRPCAIIRPLLGRSPYKLLLFHTQHYRHHCEWEGIMKVCFHRTFFHLIKWNWIVLTMNVKQSQLFIDFFKHVSCNIQQKFPQHVVKYLTRV